MHRPGGPFDGKEAQKVHSVAHDRRGKGKEAHCCPVFGTWLEPLIQEIEEETAFHLQYGKRSPFGAPPVLLRTPRIEHCDREGL
jgi:hypothetical protein